jgi:MFS family permease
VIGKTPHAHEAAPGVLGLGERILLSRRGRPLRAFRHRTFTLIWSGNLVGQLGFWMSTISFQWLVARLSHENALMLGLLYFFMNIPFVAFSPLGGVIADRLDRRRVIVLSQYGIAALATGLAVLVWTHRAPLPVVFAAAFGVGSLLALYAPASQAVVANVVPAVDLPSAVSLQSVGLNLARVVGPALAGPLLVLAGAAPSYVAYALTSLFVALVVSRVGLPEIPQERGGGVWRELRDGLAHARERRPALTVIGMVAATALFASSYVSMLAIFALKVLDRGDTGFSILLAVTGVGAVVGALSSGYRDGTSRVVFAALQMLGLALALVGLSLAAAAGHFPLVLAFAALAGGLNFAVMTRLNSILHFVVDERMRGRVMSLYLLAWAGFLPLGAVPLGALARVVGAPTALVAFASCCAAIALAVIVRYRGSAL